MPLYEYQCEQCGDVFEVRQKFSDEPLTTHEACGGLVHRLISAPAFQFKGSGWYVTDYARSSKPSTNGESGTGSPAEKSDSKPEKKETASTPATTTSKTE